MTVTYCMTLSLLKTTLSFNFHYIYYPEQCLQKPKCDSIYSPFKTSVFWWPQLLCSPTSYSECRSPLARALLVHGSLTWSSQSYMVCRVRALGQVWWMKTTFSLFQHQEGKTKTELIWKQELYLTSRISKWRAVVIHCPLTLQPGHLTCFILSTVHPFSIELKCLCWQCVHTQHRDLKWILRHKPPKRTEKKQSLPQSITAIGIQREGVSFI